MQGASFCAVSLRRLHACHSCFCVCFQAGGRLEVDVVKMAQKLPQGQEGVGAEVEATLVKPYPVSGIKQCRGLDLIQ